MFGSKRFAYSTYLKFRYLTGGLPVINLVSGLQYTVLQNNTLYAGSSRVSVSGALSLQEVPMAQIDLLRESIDVVSAVQVTLLGAGCQ
jgi:hypothetical protein